jgi:hypothetical protein
MNSFEINQALASGEVNVQGVLPKVDALKSQVALFDLYFGLKELPREAGILMIRGAR